MCQNGIFFERADENALTIIILIKFIFHFFLYTKDKEIIEQESASARKITIKY